MNSPSPESLVDLIFAKCALVYGRDFLARWEGLDLGEVKADWQRELGGLLNTPACIAYGLERLPADRPPTVLQFRALCIRPTERYVPALPAPPADPAVVATALGAIKRPTGYDPKAWAQRLRRRELHCGRLTSAQRAMWRAALAPELANEARTVEMR